MRRAKVGGYKDYFDEKETAQIDEYVAKELSAAFGYDAPPALGPAATGE